MIDGRLVSPAAARVSVFDRGFLYGDSVFETIRTYRGRLFALDEHLRRLEQSATRVFIALPVTLPALAAELETAVRASGIEEAYVRVVVTRGSGELGLTPSEGLAPLRVAMVLPLVPSPPAAYERGVRVVTYGSQRTADGTAAQGAKVSNYLVSVLALHRARGEGAVEAVVVDAEGGVVEGATSNVFAVIGDGLVTPPEEAGILVGVTRRRLLAAARELGLVMAERRLPLDELLGAQEVFISSSIRELLPVVAVDGRPIGGGVPGPVTRRLHEQFRRGVWRELGLEGEPPPPFEGTVGSGGGAGEGP